MLSSQSLLLWDANDGLVPVLDAGVNANDNLVVLQCWNMLVAFLPVNLSLLSVLG